MYLPSQYWPRPIKWANRMKSGVLYATDNSEAVPPVLVKIQYAVTNNFLYRVVRYYEEIVAEYDASLVDLVIAVHECRRHITSKATKNKPESFFFKLPCFPWTNQCFILSQESTSSYMDRMPLDPIIALGAFFIGEKQSLTDHAHHHDPTTQRLYCIAKHIFRNQVSAEKSIIS